MPSIFFARAEQQLVLPQQDELKQHSKIYNEILHNEQKVLLNRKGWVELASAIDQDLLNLLKNHKDRDDFALALLECRTNEHSIRDGVHYYGVTTLKFALISRDAENKHKVVADIIYDIFSSSVNRKYCSYSQATDIELPLLSEGKPRNILYLAVNEPAFAFAPFGLAVAGAFGAFLLMIPTAVAFGLIITDLTIPLIFISIGAVVGASLPIIYALAIAALQKCFGQDFYEHLRDADKDFAINDTNKVSHFFKGVETASGETPGKTLQNEDYSKYSALVNVEFTQ